jgi:hypothetical protein
MPEANHRPLGLALRPPPLSGFDGIAVDEPLVHVDRDCNSILRIPKVAPETLEIEVAATR